MYLGVLEHFQWDVYKPDIQICLPHRFMEGCGRGAGWVYILDMGMDKVGGGIGGGGWSSRDRGEIGEEVWGIGD